MISSIRMKAAHTDDKLTFMEQSIINNFRNMVFHEYLVLRLEDGHIMSSIPRCTKIGLATLGMSGIFTSKYIVVRGERNGKNKARLRRLRNVLKCLNCEIYDELKSSEM